MKIRMFINGEWPSRSSVKTKEAILVLDKIVDKCLSGERGGGGVFRKEDEPDTQNAVTWTVSFGRARSLHSCALNANRMGIV